MPCGYCTLYPSRPNTTSCVAYRAERQLFANLATQQTTRLQGLCAWRVIKTTVAFIAVVLIAIEALRWSLIILLLVELVDIETFLVGQNAL